MRSLGRSLRSAAVGALMLNLLLLAGQEGWAHPGSGIVVDDEGQIYFTDTGQGIWKIDKQGSISTHEGPAYHWMTIDPRSRFATGRWPEFEEPSTRIERVGKNPTLLVASDFPLTVGTDGALYYPEFRAGSSLRIFRVGPDGGERKAFAVVPTGADGGEIQWLNGMASGPDGSIYFSENTAVRRITWSGELSTVARSIAVANCQRVEGAGEHLGPMLRGLDVAHDGTVYVAASACRALLKIAPDGEITPILNTQPPWSPTGVAVKGDMIYVLEYLHTNGGDRREWVPRVRKISADGSNAIIAEIERVGKDASRPVRTSDSH